MFIVSCPHCGGQIEIVEINCAIFRHAYFKKNMEQIPPHAPKEECDELVAQGKIFGCGGPFRLVKADLNGNNGSWHAEACDYI